MNNQEKIQHNVENKEDHKNVGSLDKQDIKNKIVYTLTVELPKKKKILSKFKSEPVELIRDFLNNNELCNFSEDEKRIFSSLNPSDFSDIAEEVTFKLSNNLCNKDKSLVTSKILFNSQFQKPTLNTSSLAVSTNNNLQEATTKTSHNAPQDRTIYKGRKIIR